MQFEDTYLQSIYKLQAPRSTFVFYVARLSGHTFVFFYQSPNAYLVSL